jgi:AraC family transcriptional regulator
MDWLQRMMQAMNYIEENLDGEIDFETAARMACCSSYHFQRMFAFITGVPMSEYIRRRRLTLAAFELQDNKSRVIDIALKYGYNSPNSFTRAFQVMHGITPGMAHKKGVLLKAYPRLSFHISIKGDVEMNYRIEEKEAFEVFGTEETFSVIDGQCYRDIPEFWMRRVKDGTLDRILKSAQDKEATIQGDIYGNEEMLLDAAMYGHKSDGTLKYLICAPAPKRKIPEEFVRLEVPAFTWAVFPTEKHTIEQTAEKVQDIWKRIYSEWFATSDYEHADGPEFEMYYRAGKDLYITEVWIPVIKGRNKINR